MEKVGEQHILTKCSKYNVFQVISDLLHEFLNFNALKIILTRGSKMPQKADCTGSNKVSDCCNYISKQGKKC